MKYLIAGIDPGTKTGIAILDLNGKVVELFSSKDMGVDKTVEYITSKGKPSIIASDVSPESRFISKVASRFGCPISVPQESLSRKEKNNITSGYEFGDSHQKDALAAALTTFNRYKNRFQKIDASNLGNETKHRLLRGIRITPEIKRELVPKKVKIRPNSPKDLKNLEKRYSILKEELKIKEKEIESLMEKFDEIERRYRLKLRRDSEIRTRDDTIKDMKHRLGRLRRKLKSASSLKRLWEGIVDKSIIPVGVFPSSHDGLTLIKKKLKKKDQKLLEEVTIAFTSEPENFEILKNKGIHIPDTRRLKELEGCYFITKEDFMRIRESKETSLEKIVENYRKGH